MVCNWRFFDSDSSWSGKRLVEIFLVLATTLLLFVFDSDLVFMLIDEAEV